MRAGGAVVVAGQRRAEVRPLRRGAQEEELVKQQLAVKDVAAGDTGGVLDVLRRDHLHADDGAPDVRRMPLDRGDDRLAECVALGAVPAALDVVGRVLHEARHDVVAGRRHVTIDHRGEDRIDVGALREASVLRVVVGALDVVDARAERDRAPMQGAVARQAGELRQFREREIHLARGTADAEVADGLQELVRQVLRFEELQEAALGSTADITTFACSSSPLVSATPLARPPWTVTCSTDAFRRISTPSASAEFAIACATPPVPFLAKPQARKAPSISPM